MVNMHPGHLPSLERAQCWSYGRHPLPWVVLGAVVCPGLASRELVGDGLGDGCPTGTPARFVESRLRVVFVFNILGLRKQYLPTVRNSYNIKV